MTHFHTAEWEELDSLQEVDFLGFFLRLTIPLGFRLLTGSVLGLQKRSF